MKMELPIEYFSSFQTYVNLLKPSWHWAFGSKVRSLVRLFQPDINVPALGSQLCSYSSFLAMQNL